MLVVRITEQITAQIVDFFVMEVIQPVPVERTKDRIADQKVDTSGHEGLRGCRSRREFHSQVTRHMCAQLMLRCCRQRHPVECPRPKQQQQQQYSVAILAQVVVGKRRLSQMVCPSVATVQVTCAARHGWPAVGGERLVPTFDVAAASL